MKRQDNDATAPVLLNRGSHGTINEDDTLIHELLKLAECFCLLERVLPFSLATCVSHRIFCKHSKMMLLAADNANSKQSPL